MIEITEQYKGEIPHGVKYNMTTDELTKLLSKPNEISFIVKSFIWKKIFRKSTK